MKHQLVGLTSPTASQAGVAGPGSAGLGPAAAVGRPADFFMVQSISLHSLCTNHLMAPGEGHDDVSTAIGPSPSPGVKGRLREDDFLAANHRQNPLEYSMSAVPAHVQTRNYNSKNDLMAIKFAIMLF